MTTILCELDTDYTSKFRGLVLVDKCVITLVLKTGTSMVNNDALLFHTTLMGVCVGFAYDEESGIVFIKSDVVFENIYYEADNFYQKLYLTCSPSWIKSLQDYWMRSLQC